ncbi:hypothetical protein F5141DRAFT_1067662 [Pisolithus sp. B1]|nr:hypothetical protein F5141DRAFT_1067662 [Pisolithus sp. B1]
MGTKYIEAAFKANQKSVVAANALCELFLWKSNLKWALKLAEQTLQFADTLMLLEEGNLCATRVLHAAGSLMDATKYYTSATKGQPKHVLGAIGMAQTQMHNAKMLEHEDTCPNGNANVSTHAAAVAVADLEMHLEVAHFQWEERPEQMVMHSMKLCRSVKQLLNNPSTLQCMDSHLDMAQSIYKVALTKATCVSGSSGEAMSTSLLYNLARLYEDKEDLVMTKEAYDKLLACHPEYIDGWWLNPYGMSGESDHFTAKSQQAHMLANLNQVNDNRKSRDPNLKALEEHKHGFQCTVETYQKALQFNPLCIVAAQGLAIVTAEDALGAFSGVTGINSGGNSTTDQKHL